MQEQQFDALKSALDPTSLTEARKAEGKTFQENKEPEGEIQTESQDSGEKTVISVEEARDLKVAEARQVPLNQRVSQIAEACGGTRDPDLLKS